MKDCTCEDRAIGIKKIADAQFSYVLHHGPEYDGPFFRYCPWCGTVLEATQSIAHPENEGVE